MACYHLGRLEMRCCDIFGNTTGNWTHCIEDQMGSDGNISADPLFCDSDNEDFTLQAGSPCALENNPECDLIGAWPVECDSSTAVDKTTWGQIKRRFRE